ncbi:MAG: glycosyltransferase family 2 protein [Actinobacteria bacterium]|nr:glycosyltransferase family 2 protein [Actinomycetota bacterium]
MARRIGVVVVTHESGAVVGDLLDSLAAHEPDVPVVVVDDASPSGPPDVGDHQLIVASSARGYAASCNAGVEALREHGVSVVALLNPDVRLQGPSLTELARMFAERRRVGIATGPLLDPDGERLPSAWGPTSIRRALTFAAGYEPVRLRAAAGAVLRARSTIAEASRQLDDMRVEGHVIGGTMIVRLSCWDELGGLDEDFYLYWEDADICYRAREAGWEVRILPCTPFCHADGSTGTLSDEDVTDDRWSWFVAGATRFGQKHLVPGQAKQLEAALRLGRRLHHLRQRG